MHIVCQYFLKPWWSRFLCDCMCVNGARDQLAAIAVPGVLYGVKGDCMHQIGWELMIEREA